jgi:hypothetical protein
MQVDKQPEVGVEAYDIGAKELTAFFKQELSVYVDDPALDPLGKKIIDICMNDGSVEDYVALPPSLIVCAPASATAVRPPVGRL